MADNFPALKSAVQAVADRSHPNERELTGFEPWVLDALLEQGATADDPLAILIAEEEAELVFFGRLDASD